MVRSTGLEPVSPWGVTLSTWCVYQFHHNRKLLSYPWSDSNGHRTRPKRASSAVGLEPITFCFAKLTLYLMSKDPVEHVARIELATSDW